MGKVYVFSLPNGRAAVIRLAPNLVGSNLTDAQWEVFALAKTKFEFTRPRTPEGLAEHFDPGNPAHMGRVGAMAVTEMDEADLPVSGAARAKRNDWVVQGGRVVVSATPLGP